MISKFEQVIAVQHSKQFNRPTPKLLSKDEARGIASNNIAKLPGLVRKD